MDNVLMACVCDEGHQWLRLRDIMAIAEIDPHRGDFLKKKLPEEYVWTENPGQRKGSTVWIRLEGIYEYLFSLRSGRVPEFAEAFLTQMITRTPRRSAASER